jgi:hypothetical protein
MHSIAPILSIKCFANAAGYQAQGIFKYFLVIVLMLYCRFSWADMRVYYFVMHLSNMAIEFSPRSGNRHGGAKWNLIAHV